MHPPANHKDINMHKPPPEGISETEKALRLAWFWQRFHSPFREAVVREVEESPDYPINISKGIQVALMRGLNEIDLEKMHDELNKAGLLLEEGEFPTEIFPKKAEQ